MELRELSKLQIRAEVMMMLQKLSNIDALSKEEQDKYLEQLKSIKNSSDVVEILAKELDRVEYKKAQVICYFLMEIGKLDQLKDILWSYIKNPNTSDAIKDLANITLRTLGDSTDPEEYLSYLDDPKKIIDQETERLLEIAIVNPEAQIDFLDFLFSMSEPEQVNLIQSLKEDYSGEYLANILVPALESRIAPNLDEVLIEALGNTKSPFAVPVLLNTERFSGQERIKKLARKSLNLLKLSGINIDEAGNDQRGFEICSQSEIYKCYASHIDGIGSQGIIISRLKENQDVLMFSTVINDVEGVVDCFGFNGISKSDFARIIDRFQSDSTRVFVTPEYCRHLLEKAELINKINNYSIPYEYISWKSLIYDIPAFNENIEDAGLKWAKKELVNDGYVLYTHPDFKHWFLEDDDHPKIKPMIDKIISDIAINKSSYIDSSDKLLEYLESEITGVITHVFDKNLREVYRNRLLNESYLLDTQELTVFRDIASSVAESLGSDLDTDIEHSTFLRQLLRKTISEGLLRYQQSLDKQKKPHKIAAWNSKISQHSEDITNCKLSIQDLDVIINVLYGNWFKEN